MHIYIYAYIYIWFAHSNLPKIKYAIFYSATLVGSGELDVNNFFSFLAAMMLAYQPVRSLATLNITFSQGFSGAYRILPLIYLFPTIYIFL